MNRSLRASLVAGTLLGGCALLAVLLLAGTEWLTRERIAQAGREAERAALAVVLAPDRYDNDPSSDRIEVVAPGWLGSAAPLTVRRARLGGAPAALLVEAIAPDGYAGPIRLLVGVDIDGRVSGVRVIAHRETPGLGDRIEPSRSDWIDRFTGRALGDPPAARWTVRKHGGAFDQFAGATVTPRAIVHAVRRVLQYVDRHADALYAAPIGERLQHDDGPTD